MEDVARDRRFALAVGLVLLVYSAAGVELAAGERITPLGLPLKINRPDWLSLGLVLASIYAIYRYYLHALFLRESPMRSRAAIRWGRQSWLIREISSASKGINSMAKLVKADEERVALREKQRDPLFPQVPPTTQEVAENRRELERAEGRKANLEAMLAQRVLPTRFWILNLDQLDLKAYKAFPTVFGVGPRVITHDSDNAVELELPRASRLLAWTIDVDYMLPVFVNLGALAVFSWKHLQPYL